MRAADSSLAVVADFASVGIRDICLWGTTRKPSDNGTSGINRYNQSYARISSPDSMGNVLPRFHRINGYEWCDERLLRIMKASFSNDR